MKERIVIEKEVLEKLIKALPVQWFDNEGEKKIVLFGKEYKTEKEPTNWEELKELCKGITLDLKVCKDGTIYCYEYCLAKNRTIEQMWQIIKSLIGEE